MMPSKSRATIETTVQDVTKPKRVQNDTRMILHVERVHGQRYRDWCAANGVTVRHGLGKLHERLAASEEARQNALTWAAQWSQERDAERERAEDLSRGLTAVDEERWQVQNKLGEVSSAMHAATRKVHAYEAMTAWDHVRAAWQNGDIVDRGLMVGLALLAFGGAGHATLLVWEMI